MLQLSQGITFVGGTGTSTLIGPDRDITWNITGPNTGTLGGANFVLFSGVEALRGASHADRFVVNSGGSISGGIDGGNGTDTVVGADTANSWNLTGSDAGMLNGSSKFSGIANITGGAGDDAFTVASTDNFAGQIDGGAGNNTLTGPDADTSWTIDGANKGTLTPSGSSNPTSFVSIQNLTGGSKGDTFSVEASGSLSGTLEGGPHDVPTATTNTLDFLGTWCGRQREPSDGQRQRRRGAGHHAGADVRACHQRRR